MMISPTDHINAMTVGDNVPSNTADACYIPFTTIGPSITWDPAATHFTVSNPDHKSAIRIAKALRAAGLLTAETIDKFLEAIELIASTR